MGCLSASGGPAVSDLRRFEGGGLRRKARLASRHNSAYGGRRPRRRRGLNIGHLAAALSVRAQAIAAAVTTSPKPHCQILAQYISSLLISGSDSETSELQSVLENAPASAFSDSAQGALIGLLRTDMALALQNQHGNLASLFIRVAARYFLAEPERAGLRPVSSAQNSLLQFVHSIATFEPARTAVRALPPELAKQVAQKAAALAGDARVQPDFRAMAAELRALVESKQ